MTAIVVETAATASAAYTPPPAAVGGHSQQQLQQLPLQMFSSKTPSDLLLQQLAVSSSSNLTKLDLTGPIFAHTHAAPQAAAEALAGLTGLRSLSLCLAQVTEDQPDALSSSVAAAMLPALAHLTALTALNLLRARASDIPGLQYLPESLQQLAVSTDDFGPEMEVDADMTGEKLTMQLGHITALTALQLSGSSFGVFCDDVLPPTLVTLTATDPGVIVVEPLLELQHLQRLTVHLAPPVAAKLKQLSSLQQLRDVQLHFTSGSAAADAAEFWQALPVSAVRLYNMCDRYVDPPLPAAAVLGISKLQGLTCLHVKPCRAAATAQQFAAVLAQLTGLVELELQSMLLAKPLAAETAHAPAAAPAAAAAAEATGQPAEAAAVAAGVAASGGPLAATEADSVSSASALSRHVPDYSGIGSAIAGLPALQRLRMDMVHLGAAVAQLAAGPAAAALTELQLTHCMLEDAFLLPVLQQMSALRKLDVSCNILLSNAVLEAVAAQLTRLEELDVRFSSMTSAAADRVRVRLPQLKVLQAGRPSRQVSAVSEVPPLGKKHMTIYAQLTLQRSLHVLHFIREHAAALIHGF
jgi:hypothetical protein